MPLYEYQCDACGHRFEAIRKFSDAPLEQCPKCGGHIQKLQSAPAIQFKGSGWYITDYARKDGVAAGKSSETPAAKDGSSAPAAAADSGASKSEGSGSGKSDSGSSSKADSGSSATTSSSGPTKTAT